MPAILTRLSRFGADERGPTTVEYAVMLAFVILVCFGAIASLGPVVKPGFSNAQRAFTAAPASP